MRSRWVCNTPATFTSPVEVTSAVLYLRLEHSFLHNKTVACKVLFGASRGAERNNIGLYDGVVEAVEHRVNPKGEKVLVVVCGDTWSHSRAIRVRFVLASDVHLENTGKTDFQFDVTILIEIVVPDIL